MYIVISCFDCYKRVEHYYMFETVIDPQVAKNMFENFKSTYDIDEAPTLRELEAWLDDAVKHGILKPVEDWECWDIDVNMVEGGTLE